MSTSGMLQDKRAVVFGGGGSIGAAVAQELASEGAEVFLAGRSSTSVELVAKQITATGGHAHAEVVDAVDTAAVEDYLDTVVQQAGGIDVEFNATGPRISEYGHGKPAIELSVEELMTAFATIVRSQFITARAAARHMLTQASGVIIFLTASPARLPMPGASGIGAAYGAIENVMRTMALELGPCRRQSGLPPHPRQPRHAIDSGRDRIARQDAEHHRRPSRGPAGGGDDAEGLARNRGHREGGRVPGVGQARR